MSHDDHCERGMRVYLPAPRSSAEPSIFRNQLCNCRRRARLGSGETVPPTLTVALRCSRCGHPPRRVDGEFVCRRCLVVVAGSDQYDRTCFRTRCGRRLYARETTPADEKQPRCHVCARRPMVKPAGVAPPVATWSNVRRFDLTDTEEL